MADNGLFDRIAASTSMLESNNEMARQGQSTLNEGRENFKHVADQLKVLSKKSLKERKDMSTYLEHFTNFTPKENVAKVEELLAKSKKTEELFNNKIIEESESSNSSMINLIKLIKAKEKTVHDAEDRVETLINKSIEKNFSKGEHDFVFQAKYLVARAVRLKQRKEYKEEENKVLSESTSQLSAVDYVVDQMETEMPSYTDPED